MIETCGITHSAMGGRLGNGGCAVGFGVGAAVGNQGGTVIVLVLRGGMLQVGTGGLEWGISIGGIGDSSPVNTFEHVCD